MAYSNIDAKKLLAIAKDVLEKLNEALEEALDRPQVSEEDRWAAIGRKPGEFKKGDIVVVTGEIFSNIKYYGVLDGINPSFSDERHYFREFGRESGTKSTEKVPQMELITPVGARFDLK